MEPLEPTEHRPLAFKTSASNGATQPSSSAAMRSQYGSAMSSRRSAKAIPTSASLECSRSRRKRSNRTSSTSSRSSTSPRAARPCPGPCRWGCVALVVAPVSPVGAPRRPPFGGSHHARFCPICIRERQHPVSNRRTNSWQRPRRASSVAAMATAKNAPKQLPTPNSDFYPLGRCLECEELGQPQEGARLHGDQGPAIINKYWSDDAFPFELLPSFKGTESRRPGFEAMAAPAAARSLFGFVAMELARVDARSAPSSASTVVWRWARSISTARRSRSRSGLPAMARFEKIGCFGLTEPLVGSERPAV